MKKVIMIFGAGINQLELIREANKLNLITVVIDPQPDPPGKFEADFFYQVSGADYNTTKAIATRHKVNGIITGQMEKPLRLMSRLAEEMGFIFNSREVTERCLDKWLMKKNFQRNNIPCAKGILIKPEENLTENITENLKYPVIIKPRDSFSSQGVYKCNSFDEIKTHIEESRHYSSNGDILSEEFIEGKEYSIEALTFQAETTIIQFTEKFITQYPNTVEMAHLQPANLTQEEKEAISRVVKETLKALGIRNSASHTEVMMTEDGPKVIETGARLGGDFIGSYLTKASTGISMDRAVIEIALGYTPDLSDKKRAFSFIKYLELPAGKILQEIGKWEEILKNEDMIFAGINLKVGDIVSAVTDSAKRPVFILVKGKSRREVFQKAELYSRQLLDFITLI